MRACQIFHYQRGLPKKGGYHFRGELLTHISIMFKFSDQDTKKNFINPFFHNVEK